MVDVTSQKEPDEPPKTGAACHGGMLQMEKRSENYVQSNAVFRLIRKVLPIINKTIQ